MNNKTLDFTSKLLKDTMQLDMHYLIDPYNNLSTFDRFLRDSLQNSDMLYQEILNFLTTLTHNTFCIMTDCYQLNYVFFYPYQNKTDLVSIGPYFNDEITEDYWRELMNNHKLTLSNLQSLKSFLYGVPIIGNNLYIISIISNIISYINPDAKPFTVTYHDFNLSHTTDTLLQPNSNFDVHVNRVAQRYAIEQQLLKHISTGNIKGALEEAEKFVSAPFEPRLKNSLRDHKTLLITANTLFRKAVEVNEIHPVYLHEISSKYVNQIENVTSLTALNILYEKIIRGYCNLVKTKSTKQYSPIVRQTLHFIDFNLNAKISLNELAEKYNVSVPYLSNQFKKEVGTTIITYANQLRINTAIKLLNTSSLPIQDIAYSVGIYDFNYFTKVFKKEIGLTPSDYRKKITQTIE
jgi:two-component system, response regulator YesN